MKEMVETEQGFSRLSEVSVSSLLLSFQRQHEVEDFLSSPLCPALWLHCRTAREVRIHHQRADSSAFLHSQRKNRFGEIQSAQMIFLLQISLCNTNTSFAS